MFIIQPLKKKENNEIDIHEDQSLGCLDTKFHFISVQNG